MFQATLRTITELLDSKKAAYAFIATITACVLHLYFGLSIDNALLLVSPLGVATLSQAHVDAATAKSKPADQVSAAVTTPAPAPAAPAAAAAGDAAKTDG